MFSRVAAVVHHGGRDAAARRGQPKGCTGSPTWHPSRSSQQSSIPSDHARRVTSSKTRWSTKDGPGPQNINRVRLFSSDAAAGLLSAARSS